MVRAQTTAFTYQGRLTDGGSPANGSYILQFKLFDAVLGGTQIGATISDVSVTAANGVFSTTLDFGAAAVYVQGVKSDQFFNAGRPELLGKCVEFIKSQGVPGGIGAHKLEVIVECEKRKIPADFYIKTLHHHRYPGVTMNYDSMWCSNPEETIEFMQGVQKPWIAFKVLAAGAIPPQSAFPHAFENGADFVLAGMYDFEIAEDVEITRTSVARYATRARPWRG